MDEKYNCNATYGLIRSDVLRKTRLQQNYTGSDRTLICELGLYGPFFEIQEPLFYKRYHAKNVYVDMRARMAWFNPALKGRVVFPYWMQFFDHLRVIFRVPLPTLERIRCLVYMLRWFIVHAKKLSGDLAMAILSLRFPLDDLYRRRNKNADIYNWE